MRTGHFIHGHAIVSSNDRIADAEGNMPQMLRNETDWCRFQAALNEAVLVVVGRRSHEARPNVRRRRRMIVSTSSPSLLERPDGWWWNPAKAPIEEALQRAAPEGGIVAIPGGRSVFDLFLVYGFDGFDLARSAGVRLPGGIPVFSECRDGTPSGDVLRRHDLALSSTEQLDPLRQVSVELWRRSP